jgi:hypothetical protein
VDALKTMRHRLPRYDQRMYGTPSLYDMTRVEPLEATKAALPFPFLPVPVLMRASQHSPAQSCVLSQPLPRLASVEYSGV